MRLKGVVYDVGRAMGAHSVNWRPDYSTALMRRELEIVQADLHATAVRLVGRDPRRLLEAAEYALSIGLEVWMGPELWNASPQSSLRFVTEAARAADPLFQRFGSRLTFCVGNELTLFMRGVVPGRTFSKRLRPSNLREVVLSDQATLRSFLADTAAAVRRVSSGPITYAALPFERVDWNHFDIVGVNYYRQSRQGLTDEQYIGKISGLQATGLPVVISEFGFATCEDADNPEYLGTFNATVPSMLGSQLPVIGKLMAPRVKMVRPRDEKRQAALLVDQLALLDTAGVDGGFVMCFSFPLAPYSADPRHDIDATSLSIVRTVPHRQQLATVYPETGWEPKEAFRAIGDYYATH